MYNHHNVAENQSTTKRDIANKISNSAYLPSRNLSNVEAKCEMSLQIPLYEMYAI